MKGKWGACGDRLTAASRMRIVMRMKTAHKSRAAGRPKKSIASHKRAVNLSVDASLVAAARKQGLNLSRVLDDALRQQLATARAEGWARENRQAIEDYNERIERDGVFGDKLRQF
jgi:antitoxin CcdA